MQKKDSIKTVSAQFFRLSPNESLAQCVARAMAELASQTTISPVIVVGSPFAVQAIKQALARSDWPGRSGGAPFPWCGSLEQGFSDLVSEIASGGVPSHFPRSAVVRRIELAQHLLDHPGLSSSLGGSAKAALELAGQWIEIFEGWEWLALGNSNQPRQDFQGQIGSDVQTLRKLQHANQQPHDRAFWAKEQAPKRASYGRREVWFCMGQTPSDLELAIAKTVWGASDTQIRVFALALPETLPLPKAARQLISAHSLEEAAWSAVQVILRWRSQGLDDIGVVPLDRKVVRRVRALLDRAGEPFNDRSGWSLDTTVAATALAGLSDLLCGRGTTQQLLEWLSCPFVSRALQKRFEFGRARRQALDSALRSFGRIAPITLAALLEQDALPSEMRTLLPLCNDQRAALQQWSAGLLSALDLCGLEEELANDAAGQSVIAALQILAAESVRESEPVSAALWQSVLAEVLSQSRFSEPPSEAAVRICSVSALLWRSPQAVLIIGAEAGRFPQRGVPRFFEPKRFAEMGLQLAPEQMQSELFAQFVSAWIASFPMSMIACSEKPDAEVEFSGWVELLALNAHDVIERTEAPEFIARRAVALEDFSADVSLQARFDNVLPTSLSVSSLQSLANCAYQFYLQTLCGYAPIEPLQEEAAPTDLGSLLHWVLRGAVNENAGTHEWQAWLEKEIDRILGTGFSQERRDQRLSLTLPQALRASLRAEAMAVVPELAKWLGGRHCEEPQTVWQSTITEHPVSRVLEPLGITIKGQIDRIEKTDHGLALIDFKTTSPSELKRRLKTIEDDVQLALYAWMLSPQKIQSASYVSIRREGVEKFGVGAESGEALTQRVEATVALIAEKLKAIANGEPIQAEGMNKHKSICERCAVRGICRRDDVLALDSGEGEGE